MYCLHGLLVNYVDEILKFYFNLVFLLNLSKLVFWTTTLTSMLVTDVRDSFCW